MSRYPVNMVQPQQQQQQVQGRMTATPPAGYYYAATNPQIYSAAGFSHQLSPQQLISLQQQQQQQLLVAQQQQAGNTTNPFLHQHPQLAHHLLYHQQQVHQYQQQAAQAQQQALAAAHAAQQPQSITQIGGSHSVANASAAGNPSAVGSTEQSMSGKGKLEVEDEYGLQTLLKMLMPPPPMSTAPSVAAANEPVDPATGRTPQQHLQDQANFVYVMRGFDLHHLGLSVSQQGLLHTTTATLPFDERQHHVLPEFRIPECYKKAKPKPLSMKSFNHFKEETLFYIFYSMPRDVLHLAAARALYERGWRYHRKQQQWFQHVPSEAAQPAQPSGTPAATPAPVRRETVVENYEGRGRALIGCCQYFDPATWKLLKTAADHVILASEVEDQGVLQRAMEEAARQQQLKQQQQQQPAASA